MARLMLLAGRDVATVVVVAPHGAEGADRMSLSKCFALSFASSSAAGTRPVPFHVVRLVALELIRLPKLRYMLIATMNRP